MQFKSNNYFHLSVKMVNLLEKVLFYQSYEQYIYKTKPKTVFIIRFANFKYLLDGKIFKIYIYFASIFYILLITYFLYLLMEKCID